MAIAINHEQAEKINGAAVDQCFMTSFVLRRDFSGSPFTAEIKFSMALATDAGDYVATRRERTILIPDVEGFALSEAMNGRTDFAYGIVGFQKAVAQAMRQLCQDLSTAHYVEPRQ